MTVKLAIPAQAGIQVAFEKVKMDPRFRGDDDFLSAAHCSKMASRCREYGDFCADRLPKMACRRHG
jgi:hypothetical protein